MIKWHDLTKHPDDLPKLNADGSCKVVAIVIVNERKEEFGYVASYREYDRGWIYYKSDIDVTTNDSGKVSRWAYLDGDGEDAPEPSPKKKVIGLRKRLMDDIFNINMRVCESLKFIKGYESDFPLGETTLAVKGTLAQVESKIESAFSDYERGEKCD